MNTTYKSLLIGIFAAAMACTVSAQGYKMTTPIASGVATPDKLETSLGTLELNYGYPEARTARRFTSN